MIEQPVEDNKPTEPLTAQQRANLKDVAFVLKVFALSGLNRYQYSPNLDRVNIKGRIANMDNGIHCFSEGRRKDIAKSFWEELDKLKGTEFDRGNHALAFGDKLPKLTGGVPSPFDTEKWNPKFTDQELINLKSGIGTICKTYDSTHETDLHGAFIKALSLPRLPSETVDQSGSSKSRYPFWKPAVAVVGASLLTAIYDSQQDWAMCHAIASHPQISAPVGAVLFLAFLAVCYGCYKSKGEEAGNPLQL